MLTHAKVQTVKTVIWPIKKSFLSKSLLQRPPLKSDFMKIWGQKISGIRIRIFDPGYIFSGFLFFGFLSTKDHIDELQSNRIGKFGRFEFSRGQPQCGGLEIEARLPNHSKFCENSESVRFLKLRSTQKRKKLFFLRSVNLVHAPYKSNLQFRGYLRPIWPQKSRAFLLK